MLPAIQQRIVQIELPLADGDFSYFSGYMLAENVLITCAHGFSESPHYASQQPLRLFTEQSNAELMLPAENYADLLQCEDFVLYHSPVTEYDLLIFYCDGLNTLKAPYQELQTAGFYAAGQWAAGGFPFFARANTATQGYRNFDGTFSALETGNHTLSLKVEQPEIAAMQDWASVSGSPIFINSKLAGIISQYSDYQDAQNRTQIIPRELQATCLMQVLNKDANFKALIERLRREDCQYHYQQLRTLLKNNASICEGLALLLGCEANVEAVLAALSTQNRSQWRLNLQNLVGRSPHYKALLKTLFEALMAYHYEQAVCLESVQQAEQGIYVVPIAYEEMCEFLMAAHDGVAPSFRQQQERVVASKYSLNAPPENGIHSQIQDEQAVISALQAAEADENAVIERLFGDFKPARQVPKDKKAVVLKRLARELDENKRHYYWPITLEAGQEQRIQQLHLAFPLIKILQLAGDDDVFEEDELLVSELERFIKD